MHELKKQTETKSLCKGKTDISMGLIVVGVIYASNISFSFAAFQCNTT